VTRRLPSHVGDVRWAAFLDANRVVSTGWDATIRVTDLRTGAQRVFGGLDHGGSLSSSAASPDGRYVVTAGFNQPFRCWDLRTGTIVAEFGGFGGRNTESVAFSRDGRLILTGRSDGRVTLWRFEP
jgi:WD40 repeat protein